MTKRGRGKAQPGNPLQEAFDFQARTGAAPKPPFDPRELFHLAARGVYLGTSSWKYRGWEGLIYQGGYSSEAQFQRASLREYTSYFPCVGVDFTYFAWPVPDMMAYLVESTPENFRLCPKVTKRITLSSFPDLPAYGKWAGKKNPDFLNADLFVDQFLKPIERLKGRLGIVLFEFSGPEEGELEDLRRFLRAIPRDFPYALEIRNPALVRPDFYRLLNEEGVSPAFSLWTRMPSIAAQVEAYRAAGPAPADLPIAGLGLLKAGRTFEEAVRNFQPYREVGEEYPEGREDLAALGHLALETGRKAYLLVNNRLEGSAPHTVGALSRALGR
ncbi:MAG: DUF72 domain-containing protein [Proteobacteria bacterium]|nr:MAG: DUF72 domain-containing protein [Pseudomonadota bacterium]